MKDPTEELDLDQIARGSERVASTSPDANFVLPLGVQALPGGLVWIVEFDTGFPPLRKVSEGVYRLTPPVQGDRLGVGGDHASPRPRLTPCAGALAPAHG